MTIDKAIEIRNKALTLESELAPTSATKAGLAELAASRANAAITEIADSRWMTGQPASDAAASAAWQIEEAERLLAMIS